MARLGPIDGNNPSVAMNQYKLDVTPASDSSVSSGRYLCICRIWQSRTLSFAYSRLSRTVVNGIVLEGPSTHSHRSLNEFRSYCRDHLLTPRVPPCMCALLHLHIEEKKIPLHETFGHSSEFPSVLRSGKQPGSLEEERGRLDWA